MNATRNCAYVTNSADNTLSVINNSNVVIATIAGFSNPFGVDVNPVKNRVYVGNRSGNLLSAVADPCQ